MDWCRRHKAAAVGFGGCWRPKRRMTTTWTWTTRRPKRADFVAADVVDGDSDAVAAEVRGDSVAAAVRSTRMMMLWTPS